MLLRTLIQHKKEENLKLNKQTLKSNNITIK